MKAPVTRVHILLLLVWWTKRPVYGQETISQDSITQSSFPSIQNATEESGNSDVEQQAFQNTIEENGSSDDEQQSDFNSDVDEQDGSRNQDSGSAVWSTSFPEDNTLSTVSPTSISKQNIVTSPHISSTVEQNTPVQPQGQDRSTTEHSIPSESPTSDQQVSTLVEDILDNRENTDMLDDDISVQTTTVTTDKPTEATTNKQISGIQNNSNVTNSVQNASNTTTKISSLSGMPTSSSKIISSILLTTTTMTTTSSMEPSLKSNSTADNETTTRMSISTMSINKTSTVTESMDITNNSIENSEGKGNISTIVTPTSNNATTRFFNSNENTTISIVRTTPASIALNMTTHQITVHKTTTVESNNPTVKSDLTTARAIDENGKIDDVTELGIPLEFTTKSIMPVNSSKFVDTDAIHISSGQEDEFLTRATFSGLMAALVFGVMFFGAVTILVSKRCYDSWQRRHYSKVDYLDGLSDD